MTTLPPSSDRERPSATASLVLIGCFIVATMVMGWWGIPVVGLVWAWWGAHHRGWHKAVAPVSAGAAVVAWSALLAWTAVVGRLGQLLDTLGALIRAPGAVLIALTLVFAALLGWSAAVLVA